MSRTIYLVWGQTGEYEEAAEWIVCAYTNAAKARGHADQATAEVGVILNQYDSYLRVPPGANRFDPHMQLDYTGTRYTVSEIELHD